MAQEQHKRCLGGAVSTVHALHATKGIHTQAQQDIAWEPRWEGETRAERWKGAVTRQACDHTHTHTLSLSLALPWPPSQLTLSAKRGNVPRLVRTPVHGCTVIVVRRQSLIQRAGPASRDSTHPLSLPLSPPLFQRIEQRIFARKSKVKGQNKSSQLIQ
jgi:hypothetical protein